MRWRHAGSASSLGAVMLPTLVLNLETAARADAGLNHRYWKRQGPAKAPKYLGPPTRGLRGPYGVFCLRVDPGDIRQHAHGHKHCHSYVSRRHCSTTTQGARRGRCIAGGSSRDRGLDFCPLDHMGRRPERWRRVVRVVVDIAHVGGQQSSYAPKAARARLVGSLAAA
jgi:hypothetical protein